MNRSMFRIVPVLIFACALVWCAPSFAGDNARLYIEGEVGASFLGLDSGGYNTAGGFFNTGSDTQSQPVFGAAVGGKFFDIVRADLSFSYRPEAELKTHSLGDLLYESDVQTESLLFSVYFEPFTFYKFTPYVGGGVGCTWIDLSTTDGEVDGSKDGRNFTWQAEAGLQYGITEHLTAKVGYRYMDLGEVDCPLGGGTDGNFTADLETQEVVFGLRYMF